MFLFSEQAFWGGVMVCTMNFRNGFGIDHQTAVNNLLHQFLEMTASPTGSSVFGSSSAVLLWWSSEKSERLEVIEADCLSIAFCF